MYEYFLLASFLGLVIFVPLHFFLKKKGIEKNFLFYSGCMYVFISLPMIPSLFLLIGVVSFLIGLIYIFVSRKSIPIALQILIGILPITLLLGYTWYSDSSKNIFLIPKNFRGRVVIIHGCSDGADREFEGTYRVYKIPPNGILKSKFSFAGSAFDSLHSKYFFVDESGNREPILESDPNKIYPHGLWTLSYTKKEKGETIIDFIMDHHQESPQSYESEKNALYQKEIDSCVDK